MTERLKEMGYEVVNRTGKILVVIMVKNCNGWGIIGIHPDMNALISKTKQIMAYLKRRG